MAYNTDLLRQWVYSPEPCTLGDALRALKRGEKMVVEFPNGYTRTFGYYQQFDKRYTDSYLVESCDYDGNTQTYYVKLSKYKLGLCEFDGDIEASKDEELINKALKRDLLNSHYGIDPISKYFKIKRIICDGPATIIFWNDGTKTVVKAQDEIDYEKGILYAALKKLATKKEYNDILRAIDKGDEACKYDPIKFIRDTLFPDHPLSPSEAEEFTKKETPKKKREPKYQKCPVCGRGYNLNYYRTSKLSKKGFVDIRCSNCDTLFRVKGDWYEPKWWTKLEHEVLTEGNPEPTNQCGTDRVEAEKPKKKAYKRHPGDSSQICPYCGGNWVWSSKRRLKYYADGFIDIPCKHCGKTFRVQKKEV